MEKKYLGDYYNFLRPISNQKLIRIGHKIDGGYVVDEKIIKEIDILITFGLGDGSNTSNLQWSFEEELLKINNNVKIHIYDHTVGKLNYYIVIFRYLRRFLTFRSNLKILKSRFDFFKIFLKFINHKNIIFYQEKIVSKIINKKKESNIEKVMERLEKKNNKIMLKCDIEGSEYEIIEDLMYYSDNIDMLVFEFHWIDKNKEKFVNALKKLCQKFAIIHLHANNHYQTLEDGLPIILEISLKNKKNCSTNELNKFEDSFPKKDLDFPCNPYLKDIEINFTKQ